METNNEEKKSLIKKNFEYPKKPKRGEKLEKTVKVICNLKEINFKEALKGKHIMKYNISYDPEISEENNSMKKIILRQIKEDLNGIFEKYYLTGDTIFVCTKKAKDKIRIETKVQDIEYQVIFKKELNDIDCSKIIDKSKDNIKVKNLVENILKSIIIANNHVIKFSDQTFYDYYDIETCGSKKKCKIWNGYTTSILITGRGLLLQINDKSKMITNMTAYEKMKEIAVSHGNDFSNESCRREITSFFKGRTLITQYGNYRAYKIGDIDFDRNVSNVSFNMENKDGTQTTISIKDYYENQYKITFKYEDQPLFIEETKSEKKGKIKYLIPELLYLTGNDELNAKEKEELSLMSRNKNNPNEKFKRLEKGVSYLSQEEKKQIFKNGKGVELPSPNNIRAEWGINFGENFIELNSFCLPMPEIQFANSKFEEIQLKNCKFTIKKVLHPVNFDENNCLLLTFKHLVDIAKNDCEQINKAAQAFGLEFNLPKLYVLENTKKNELIQELEKIDFNNGKKMAILVLDNDTKNLYPAIKDYIYSQGGVASQCMLHDEKPGKKKFSMSYYSNILNQMVVKAQGELFEIKFCDELSNSLSMIVGIEINRIKDKIKYIVSCSYNKRLNKYYTDSKIVDNKDNPVDDLLLLLGNSLNYFKSVNGGKLPSTIIIYRQGGNESWNEKLIKNEIPEIEKFFGGKTIEGCYKENYKPKLTVFSVNKKTNLKFYQKLDKEFKVVPIGTCIDQDVTTPEVFEFYLQCIQVEKGAATPVQFLCVFNNNEEISMTDFEKITYNQSYYRWNSTGPTRIPVALVNAEEANRYINRYLTHEVLPCLKDSPYFI
jgi:hypothetical protein